MRRAQQGGAFAAVVKKGDPQAGACLVKLRLLDGTARLYLPERNMSGERVWWPLGPKAEPEIDAYIMRRIDDDPDLWILEIEDKAGRHFLTEPIEEA